jgi:FkbM family methyltransferase
MFFARQIAAGRFATNEKEYQLLDTMLAEGDWALDIGANVGHYALRMCEIVGPSGRVIAMEPVPETFALLVANARHFPSDNVSLLNFAASDRCATVGFEIPNLYRDTPNYYQARIAEDGNGFLVLAMPIDVLAIPHRIAVVKIDVEGHERQVILGMRQLLERDHPIVIVETFSKCTVDLLHDLGYVTERLPGSSNLTCKWNQ